MNFQGLRDLLIHHLNQSVQAGEITERGLSRRVGISQPHIHNVLKGKRLLSWESADALLRELDLNLLDLINHYGIAE
jgi:plasmid maintenance system antidote protein VapI